MSAKSNSKTLANSTIRYYSAVIFASIITLVFFTNCSNSAKNSQSEVPHQPTFNQHIWPIVLKNCVPCHRKNGAGPFPLTNYEEVKRKGKTIAKVTGLRIMPPWPADPSYSHFKDEKYLSESEIATIKKWFETGMPRGNSKMELVQIPDYKSSIGKPDLVIPMDSVFLNADFRDRFYIIKIPGTIQRDTYVRALEIVAGQPKYLHHFNGHLLLYDFNKKKNVFEGQRKVEITEGEYDQDFEQLNLFNDDGTKPQRLHSAVNYLPGVFGTAYPNGIGGFKLTQKFCFVGNDLHYGPSHKEIIDKSVINVFFTDKKPSRPTGEIMLGTNGISKIVPPLKVPANKITMHRTEYRLNEDISVLTINPHLHMLGKSFLAYAIKPNGDTVNLIRIKKWDFRWQYFYTFQKMVPLPKGSLIVAIAEFDNTANNPNNPFNPPKDIGERLEYGGASMRATDEMFQFIITYTLFQQGDEEVSLSE